MEGSGTDIDGLLDLEPGPDSLHRSGRDKLLALAIGLTVATAVASVLAVADILGRLGDYDLGSRLTILSTVLEPISLLIAARVVATSPAARSDWGPAVLAAAATGPLQIGIAHLTDWRYRSGFEQLAAIALIVLSSSAAACSVYLARTGRPPLSPSRWRAPIPAALLVVAYGGVLAALVPRARALYGHTPSTGMAAASLLVGSVSLLVVASIHVLNRPHAAVYVFVRSAVRVAIGLGIAVTSDHTLAMVGINATALLLPGALGLAAVVAMVWTRPGSPSTDPTRSAAGG